MTTPIMGEIRLFAGTFAPRNWMFCQGQILSIAQNTALFAILGTIYGGNGQTTFALPDLRGRVPIHPGQGPGLPLYSQGETGGSPTHTLISTEMPAHVHAAPSVPASTTLGTQQAPGPGMVLAASNQRNAQYTDAAANTTLPGSGFTGQAGNNQPFSIMPPYLGLNYIIAVQGVFPSRN